MNYTLNSTLDSVSQNSIFYNLKFAHYEDISVGGNSYPDHMQVKIMNNCLHFKDKLAYNKEQKRYFKVDF